MYTTSTFFIKAQIPNATIPVLIDLYVQELEYQEVNDIEVNSNTINFSIKPSKIFIYKDASQFSNFSSGHIAIEETGKEYIVTFQANTSRLLQKRGILIGIMMLFCMLFGAFDEVALFTGIVVFLLFSGISYVLILLFFPVYFKGVRNNIERVLQYEKNEACR